jgi:NAD(P)-dependent dehydrogenase (short-subunit alcohol dehydrogenase family)
MRFTGKTAIVTGAARGIGRGIALRLAKEGANLAIIDLRGPAAEETAGEIKKLGGTAVAKQSDVRDSARIKEIVAELIDQFGSIDILVNNAGGPASFFGIDGLDNTPFIDSKQETWELILDVNLLGPMILTHAVLGSMIEGRKGKIINIGSVAGVTGLVKMVDYSAAKGGIIAMTKALAIELGEYNINVNCVSPGSIKTCSGAPPTYLKRIGYPDDIANAVCFLASEEADFITGQNYIVDGGRVLSTTCL